MRAKKSFKNLIFNFFQQLVGIITNLILPPLIISKFGSAINGLIQTIKQMMSYAQITGAGISAASTYSMYEPLAKKDKKNISGIYNATAKMFNKAGRLFTLIILIIAVVYPFFVNEEINALVTFSLVIIISVCGISEFFVFGKYQSIINADQNNYIIAIAQTIGNLCNILVTVLLIWLDQNIIVVQIGASIIYVARIVILYIYVKKHYKYLDENVKPMFDKINQKNDALVHQIAGLVVLSSSTIIVSIFCGLKEASVFAVYNLVFAGLNTICYIVSTSIYASFGEVIAKKDNKTLINAFNIYEWFYFCMIFVIFIVTYIMITPFIQVYTQGFTDINYVLPWLGILFVIVGLANNIRVPSVTLVNAAGHYKQTRNRAIIEMIINLVGQIVFVNVLGIYGVLVGCIMSYCYRTIDYIIYTHKYILNISPKKTFIRLIINIVMSVLVIICCSFITINVNNYIDWCMYAFGITLFVSLYFIIVNYFIERKTFIETKNLIFSIFKKIK